MVLYAEFSFLSYSIVDSVMILIYLDMLICVAYDSITNNFVFCTKLNNVIL